MLLDGDEWRRTFDAYERTAWRFEVQPTYTMPKEADNVARFLRGELKPPDHNARWHDRVRGFVATGRSIGRVRVVRQPLTEYQRYQFAWGIPGNIDAGEDIRVLDVTRRDFGLPLLNSDWWIFDDSTVVQLNYRADGTQIDRNLFTGDVTPYLEWKKIALSRSVSFGDYVKDPG
ncbi:DUF6879 family protein [Streptomyces sp. NPDC003717]|uniref:DUF6879 family protein n=1 Tax=Streptomyces sp. NPDC003717 TaxID=3154276 RepID=UPI0033A5AA64